MSFDITSATNERIKWLVRLRDRKHRDAEGVFAVEGELLYRRAVDAGLKPLVTFESGDFATMGETISVAPGVLDKASYRHRSQGIIGVFPQFGMALEGLVPATPALLLIAENIEKPGNLGAMMRNAAAAGADALITVGRTVDPFNPNTVRASTGSLFTLAVAMASWDELQPWLAERAIGLVAANPNGEVRLWDARLDGPVAIVIGAEDAGLSARARSIADQDVVIPQAEVGVDSLNASVAAAVLLFEAARQRSG